MSIKRVTVELGGKTITFETGLLAQQANGAVTVRLGDTIVFSAVTATKTPREGVDFFPLQVEYREKYYAAGKFPGGYFKREAKPSEREIVTARVTDRPLRPFFPKGYRNDVQINNMLMSADGENESDILSILAASAALMVSDIPFFGPIGAVRVGRIDGRFIYNPTIPEILKSDLNLVYAGTRELPVMIEGNADEVTEADMVAAMRFAHEAMGALCDAQLKLRELLGLPPKTATDLPMNEELLGLAREIAGAELREALHINAKQERQLRVDEVKAKLAGKLLEIRPQTTKEELFQVWDALEIEVTRKMVLDEKKRIGGRAFDEIRPLYAEVGVLPRVHGSALFMRGETQALATVTLGTSEDAQELDPVAGGPDEKNFMLHYNFPPFSVGEVGKIGATGRREIGHGNLAERSLLPVVPKDYPYAIRVVSEIMGSNGSTSMATVCVGTLALMDAGVPIRKPVAGISIGLFTAPDGRAELVTDIIGAEDHCGDMDFKVSGTREGVTGFQVDLKIRGLPWPCVEKAFAMARDARLKILDYMQTVIEKPRPDLSPYAPRFTVVKINPDKIGALIGPGGKTVRRITDETGAQIDIEDDGTVKIFATDKKAMEAAVREVSAIGAEAEVGKIYQGTVTGVKDFGAFVEILPGIEGLVHISELSDRRVRNVEDVCKVGDRMWVKCLEVQESGKIRLSRKQALAEMDQKGKESGGSP